MWLNFWYEHAEMLMTFWRTIIIIFELKSEQIIK